MRDTASSFSLLPIVLTTFIAGVATGYVLLKTTVTKKDRAHAGALMEGNDGSLFYGRTDEETKALTTIQESSKFLPSDIYGKLVRDCVVCCVDALIVRTNHKTQNKECLLVLRSSEPVKGVWWLPGGRIVKGETFFTAALRKAQEETGLSQTHLKVIQILGIWNTFFPTSHWDTETQKGTQTVNPIVLVEIVDTPGNTVAPDIKLDETSEQYKWIGLDPDRAIQSGIDKYVVQALQRLKAWNPSYM